MTSPLQAMLWELWRVSRWELFMRTFWMAGSVYLMNQVAWKMEGSALQTVLRGISLTVLLITCPFAQLWLSEIDSKSIGFSFRLGFLRPVSTKMLVLVPLVYCVGTSVLSFLVSAWLAGWGTGTLLPLWGPSTVVVALVTSTVAVIWSFSSKLGKALGLSVLATACVVSVLIVSRRCGEESLLYALGKPEFFSVSPAYYAFAWAGIIGMALATIWAVDRQRHGETLQLFSWEKLKGLLPAYREHAQVIPRTFRTPLAAQIWYEWQRVSGKVFTAGTIIPLVLLALLLPNPHWEGNVPLWVGALLLCGPLYQLLGAESVAGLTHVHGDTRLSLFDAARPLTNQQIIGIKLLVIAGSSFLAWLILVGTAMGHLALFGNWTQFASVCEAVQKLVAAQGVWFWISAVSNICFLFVCSSSAILLLGLWLPLYRLRLAFGFVAFSACLVALERGWKSGLQTNVLWQGGVWALAAVIAGGCVWGVFQSLSRRALGSYPFALLLLGWSVLVASSVILARDAANLSPVAIPNCVWGLGGSALFLPLAVTAIAPLAYGQHRQR